MKALVCALLSSALALPALAQSSRWEHFMTSANAFYSVDRRSIKRTGPKVVAWFAVEYREVQTIDFDPNKTYWSSLWRVSVHCRDESLLTLHMTHYASLERQGKQVFTATNQDKPEWYEPVLPDSIGEGIKDGLCTTK